MLLRRVRSRRLPWCPEHQRSAVCSHIDTDNGNRGKLRGYHSTRPTPKIWAHLFSRVSPLTMAAQAPSITLSTHHIRKRMASTSPTISGTSSSIDVDDIIRDADIEVDAQVNQEEFEQMMGGSDVDSSYGMHAIDDGRAADTVDQSGAPALTDGSEAMAAVADDPNMLISSVRLTMCLQCWLRTPTTAFISLKYYWVA